MIVVGLPYSFQGETTLDETRRRLRPTDHRGGDGSRLPSANELAGAGFQES